MKNKGFTLIELLAVIVILAIIAIIAVPIILNIINDSKKSSDMRSVELYGKAVENAVGNYQVKNPHDTDITLEKVQEYIKYKGNKVECTTTNINKDGTVYLAGCKVSNKDVEYTYGEDKSSTDVPTTPDEPSESIGRAATAENKTLAGIVPTGNFVPGEEYIINVDGTNEYPFYILSTEGDKVNLILSKNICSDGTLATETNTCEVAWTSQVDYNDDTNYGENGNNNKGPITAMNYLYEATKNWSNIENINMNYTDEDNTGSYGYGGITTSGTTTTITMKDGTVTARYENLKARLPTWGEMTGVGCSSPGSCPAWMVNGLECETSGYPTGTKEDISGIRGYWSLSSLSSYSYYVGFVYFYGSVGGSYVGYSSRSGSRPVITVSKSSLS